MTEALRERRDDGVVFLGFNRPEKRNAYNMAVIASLNQRLTALSRDPSVGALVLHGDERAFCSGGDLVEVLSLAEKGADLLREQWFDPLLEVTRRLTTFPVPTVAAARGIVLAGGLEIAVLCDFLVTTDDSKLGDQHINHGLIPGGGATQTLVSRLGVQRAKDLILTGRRMSGVEAAAVGLALWSVPSEEYDDRLAEFVDSLASKRSRASQMVKVLVGPEHDYEGIIREQEAAAYDMAGDEILGVLRGFAHG